MRAYTLPRARCPCGCSTVRPSYINILDALLGWQLVRELKAATNLPAAASFKHTSPAGAAVAKPLSKDFARSQFLGDEQLSPVATAYVRRAAATG